MPRLSTESKTRKKLIAGCWECFAASIRWKGNNAHRLAEAHAEETGHPIWKDAICLPPRVKQPQPAKAKPKPIKPEPLPKARLSKRNMCDGKIAHRSAATAQKAIDNTPGDRSFLNVYQCFYCGKYHVGHIIKPKGTK